MERKTNARLSMRQEMSLHDVRLHLERKRSSSPYQISEIIGHILEEAKNVHQKGQDELTINLNAILSYLNSDINNKQAQEVYLDAVDAAHSSAWRIINAIGILMLTLAILAILYSTLVIALIWYPITIATITAWTTASIPAVPYLVSGGTALGILGWLSVAAARPVGIAKLMRDLHTKRLDENSDDHKVSGKDIEFEIWRSFGN